MKSALRLLVSCLFLKFVIVMPVSAQTESDEAPQDMQQVLEMLKKQGVDEESLKDMEAVFEALSEVGAEQEASETASEKAAFLAATKGNGSATVELAGKQFEFTVTECEIRDRSITRYQVSAEQVPGEGDGSFSLSSDGVQTRGAFSLSDGDLGYLETQDQSHAVLAENQISWTGEAIDSNQIAVPIAVKITCGGEMMDYAANAGTVPSWGPIRCE